MNSTEPTPTTPTSLTSGVYWRKSLWNGAQTVPSILALKDGVVTLKSDKEVGFETPLASIQKASFSMFGTLSITVGGKKYDIVGIGASLSRPFNEAQLAELSNSNANANSQMANTGIGASVLGTGLGGAAGAGLGAVGAAAGVIGLVKGAKGLKVWQAIFKSAGIAK